MSLGWLGSREIKMFLGEFVNIFILSESLSPRHRCYHSSLSVCSERPNRKVKFYRLALMFLYWHCIVGITITETSLPLRQPGTSGWQRGKSCVTSLPWRLLSIVSDSIRLFLMVWEAVHCGRNSSSPHYDPVIEGRAHCPLQHTPVTSDPSTNSQLLSSLWLSNLSHMGLWWFKYEMASLCPCLWTLCSWLVMLFGLVGEHFPGKDLLQEVVPGSGLWEFGVLFRF